MKAKGSRNIQEWRLALTSTSMKRLKELAADPEARAVIQHVFYDDEYGVMDLVDWAVTYKVGTEKIEFLLKEAGAYASHTALDEAFAQGDRACATLLYKHGARFTNCYQIGRYIEHFIPVEQRERVVYDHRSLIKGRIFGESDKCLRDTQREVWHRENEARRSTIAVLSLARRYSDRRFKDVWPLIAHHVWYPRHQRVDKRWARESFTLRILLSIAYVLVVAPLSALRAFLF